ALGTLPPAAGCTDRSGAGLGQYAVRSTCATATATIPSAPATASVSTARPLRIARDDKEDGVSRRRCERRLRRRDPGDRHAVRRAAHVVETGELEERDRVRVAAVLAADAQLEVGLG